jgi:hypothetical protein
MAHCTQAPSCAWSESTEPKKRSRSIASRFGNAIRAMTPRRSKRSEEEPATEVCILNAAAMKNYEDCSFVKKTLSDDELSTQSGSSRHSSKISLASQSSSACLTKSVERMTPPTTPESVEEMTLPGTPDRTLESVEEMMLPGTPEEISPSSSQSCKHENSLHSELEALAIVIAKHAQSKFSGRVYQDVRNAFLAVDTNGDGKLTSGEALAFCQHFEMPPTTPSQLFKLLDPRETGLADWSSFLARYAPLFVKKTDLRRNPGMGRKLPAIHCQPYCHQLA